MQTAQPGDHVRVHYLKRFEDGSIASSRHRTPLELTVGCDHPRLPGLGLALVGMAAGSNVTVRVPTERAYGPRDDSRVRRFQRTRFPKDQPLPIGERVQIQDSKGRRRSVQIIEVCEESVLVDMNHRRAGQSLELEIELIGFLCPEKGVEVP